MIGPEFSNIPAELKQVPQWIGWDEETRNGDATKAPKQIGGAYAKTSDPSTWTTFEEVQSAYERGEFDGIGFVFAEEDPFVGIDLDDCVTDQGLTPGALDVVERLDSYTEGSPSGTGLHIILKGFLTRDRNRTGDVEGMGEIEIYEDGRYFTFTGRHLDGTPEEPKQRARELHTLCEELFGDAEDVEETSGPSEPVDLDDRQLVEKAKQADDGGKFKRLWSGDTSGYPSHSEADQALVNKLAFWTGGDRHRIDRLFRDSGLCREKWTNRPDYRKRTIDTALEGRTEFYDPSGDNSSGGKSHRSNGQADQAETDPWSKIRSTYEEDKGRARLFAAEQLESELHVATHRRSGHLYVWDHGEKVYADDGEQTIRSLLVEKLESDFSRHEAKEILGMLKPKTYRSEFGEEGFIPVANGDLEVTKKGIDLKEATPERGFRNRSEAKSDPDAEAPIFETYLKGVVHTEEERKTLQEYAGYALMYWGLPLHKALFLVGPQASGKSTFLKTVHKLLGKTTQLSPQQLVDDRFGAIELEDSWANIASDIPSELLSNVGKFKEITAGDPIHAERKYEQGYSIEPTAKHFYSANQLPEIKIDDNAFFRRVMIVAFPQTIEPDERDPDLPNKLKLELDGILTWAVDGLQRLMKNGGFTRDLEPEKTRRLWDEHASSIGQFKIRRLKVTGHSQDVEAKQEVYHAYTEFCMENGLSTETQQKLTQVLKRDPQIGQGKRTPPGWDKQTKCYVGVQLPNREDEFEPDDVPF